MIEVKQFLKTLTGDGFLTFLTFPDKENKQMRVYELHGTLEEHNKKLRELNKAGAGIFLMINQGDGKGRKANNVIRVRALFADFDGIPLPNKWSLEPSIIVESSLSKYHAYWLLADNLPLDEFKPLQKSIAEIFGSDSKVCDLPRVMRLPSFYHQKGKPFLTRLVKCDSSIRYTANQLQEIFPTKETKIHKPTFTASNSDLTSDNAKKYAQTALQNEYDLVVGATKGNRNHALNKAAYSLGQLVGGGLLDRSEVEDALTSAGLSCGLFEVEIRITISSGLRAGVKEPRYPDLSDYDEGARGVLGSNGKQQTTKKLKIGDKGYKSHSKRRYAQLRGWT